MSTNDIANAILDHQDSIVEFYTKNAHHTKNNGIVEAINELFDKMSNEKFVKALNKIRKSEKDGVELNIALVVVIAGFIEKRHKDPNMPEELIEKYTTLINKMLKNRVKDVNKKLGLDESLIADLLVIVPERSFITNEKIVGVYSQKMLRKMYILSQDKDLGVNDVETVTKIFKKIIGKNLLDLIAINVLLEKREFLKNLNEKQQAVWNLMTQFALETIESQDKKHITELVTEYVRRRKNDAKREKDGARRISLTTVDAEQYPKLAKAISKFINAHGDLEKYL